jgi:glycosyltransferase involved in cell wall biosynthesis
MSDKIKVLVLPSDTSGVGKYRSVDPHVYLNNHYKDEFFVDILFDNIDGVNFSDYHIVHFHKEIINGRPLSWTLDKIKEIQDGGTKVVMDIDDYWILPVGHPLQKQFKESGYAKHNLSIARACDYITTTTELLADKIKEKGIKNVIVIENSIDPEESQFKGETEESDKVRIGWLGGSSHAIDVKLLEGTVNRLESKHKGKYQTVLCGYDTRGTITEIKQGKAIKRPIRPWETAWFFYENVLTNNLNTVSGDYKEHLLKFNRDIPFDDRHQPYRRVWTEPVNKYALGYTKFDIALAPLEKNDFNLTKSELKIIEAGFYKKAIIAQDIGVYSSILTNAIKNGEFVEGGDGLLVSPSKNHKQWFTHLNRLIQNPDWIKKMGENLYETVKEKYHLKTTTKKRSKFYKQLINK